MNRFSAWAIAAALVALGAHATMTMTLSGPAIVVPGASLGGAVAATIKDGGPVAGWPVTFTAPASGPSVVFANGTNTITVLTNAAGIAIASGTANSVAGEADITVDSPGIPTPTPPPCAPPLPLCGTPTIALVIGGPVSLQFGTPLKATYGAISLIDARISMTWFPCALASHGPQLFAGGSVQIRANGALLGDPSITLPTTCTGGVYQMTGLSSAVELEPGTYELSAIYFPPAGLRATTAANVNLLIEGTDVALPGGGTMHVGLSRPVFASSHVSGTCKTVAAVGGRPGDAGFPAAGPSGLDLPFGLVRIDADDCTWVSDTPTVATGPLTQRVIMGIDVASLPEGTVAWTYGPTSDGPTAHWHQVRTAVSGGFATFDVVDGGTGDGASEADGALHLTLALAQPRESAIPGSFQALWWSGPAENGWGLSITQHEDRLFGALFVYDTQGEPRWVVMPSGQWNAARTAYTGNLYRPHGSPYSAYNALFLAPGDAVGSVTLTFPSLDVLRMSFTIDGISGQKTLVRQPFGPAEPLTMPPFEDLWWGGVDQNGWGFALAQQYRTAFGVLFTYDAHGDPLWFVAPSFTWRGANVPFGSNLYRTHGSPWLGVAYDPSMLTSKTVGTATLSLAADPGTLKFSVDDRTFTYPLTRQPF